MNDGAGEPPPAPARPPWLASLRARLLLLVALTLLPAFALTVWNDYQHLQDKRAEAQAAALRIAHSRAFEFAEKIEDVKSLLGIVAGFPTVRTDPALPRCSAILADMKRELPAYSNFGVAALDGTVACSAEPFDRARPPRVGDRVWFQRAMQSNGFTIGEYLVGRVTGRHSLTLSLPVRDERGMITAIAFAALDLSWLSRFVANLSMPPQSALLVLDGRGRILARHPDHAAWVGRMHPQAESMLVVAAQQDEGTQVMPGLDGISRIFAFARVPGSELTVFFGLPQAPIEAEAWAGFWRNLVFMAVILLASIALAGFVAAVLVLRRTQRLSAAAARFAAGQLDARSGLTHPDEIGRLGMAFDRMAEAVAGRERELERRVAERTAELARANADLAEASRLKSDFLASMSHELRTPLNAIIGFSEVLRDGLVGEVTAQQREYLGDVLASGNHLLALINDILDLSKVEAGKMSLELESLSLASALGSSLAIVREKAMTHRLTLDLQVAEDAGELCADARKLKQIVYNLLSNAVKFTPDGGRVTLAARRVPLAAAPAQAAPPAGTTEFVEIAVSDTGIGIAADDQQKLFAAFSQIDSALARQYEGTGLGLTLVKRLAELHGGAVGLQSAPGAGSTFRVWLPCRPAADGAAPIGGAAAAVRAPGGRRALVVEDDPQAFELLRLALDREGFSVTHAASTAEARQRLADEMPDLITLDILLPGGEDGWHFLEWLKRSAAWGHIPVVVVSIVAEEQKGVALGASAVLHKPYQREALMRVLAGLGFTPIREATARVLVIDDDPASVAHAAALLEAEGCTVDRAGGGQEGVAMALAAPPDLILLDLIMPGLSGFDVVMALRADPRTQVTPIVIVTAKELDEADHRALNGHVQAVVQKNHFSPDAFRTEVRRALGKGSATQWPRS